MTQDRTPLVALVLADDAEYFEQLRGIPKSECNRCVSAERESRVTPGPAVDGSEGARREMSCACGFTWSATVLEDGDPR
jgi:hypothetical protein